MTNVEILELIVPASLDAPDAADFLGMVDARNAVSSHLLGSEEMMLTAEEIFPRWRDREFAPICGFVARVDGRVVGRSYASWSLDRGAPEGQVFVEVHPDFRRRGIGRALLERAIDAARRSGHGVLHSDFLSSVVDSPTVDRIAKLVPPTGFGAIERGDPGAEFALAHGFALEQVERLSRLRLPIDARVLEESLATARAAAGDNYDLVWWLGETPDEWLADFALLRTRMSTDTPSGELEVTEELWTPERVRQGDHVRESSWFGALTIAARHIPSGTLAGFSELTVPEELDRPASQNDTLVLSEHRGHRLGMLMKAANLELLLEHFPGHPSVLTSNAEENRPMLSVNEALGFEPAAYGGVWERAL
jgi:GNAT superfamily N-acetyltransferase